MKKPNPYIQIYIGLKEVNEYEKDINELAKKFDRTPSSMGRQILKLGIAHFKNLKGAV